MRELQMDYLDSLIQRFAAGEISVQSEADKHSVRDMVDYLRDNASELASAVKDLTPEQLAYRLPGAPTGADASGDEEHFNTSEIATHVASALSFHWWGIARSMGHERPPFTRPPEGAKVTGTRGRIMGSGGWSGSGESAGDLSDLIRERADRFVAYLEGLPEVLEQERTIRFGAYDVGDLNVYGWLFLAAIHPAMHLHQLRVMQSQDDYPR